MVAKFIEARNELEIIAIKYNIDKEILTLEWLNILQSMMLSNALQEKRNFEKEKNYFFQLVDYYACSKLYPEFNLINHFGLCEDSTFKPFYIQFLDQESQSRKELIYRINLDNLSKRMLPIFMNQINNIELVEKQKLIEKLIMICESFKVSDEELEAMLLIDLFMK